MENYTLTIGWLYPDLMSTYGDRGNVITLQKRCEWRGISIKILPITPETTNHELSTINLLFGGGSQDREQEIVMRDLKSKSDSIHKLIEHNIPSLFVCGSPQLMGKFYEPSEGKRIEGLGIFDMETRHPGPTDDRLIGNVVAKVNWENLQLESSQLKVKSSLIVGFENHGGRTTLGLNAKPFATVIVGNGNNGEDKTEGVVYKNAIGCYFHGPLLPKNPHIADFLISKALEVKYEKSIELSPLDDSLEIQAHNSIVKKLGVRI
ncbi:MAG TPA: type 1 glutamine amidotransferase [Candidatus Levybacteria bacterium]|nr:type 1 glutamine amidotransferase [Candidatus Levybacteria bacterium]